MFWTLGIVCWLVLAGVLALGLCRAAGKNEPSP